eukprot:11852819-Alexandrium_andersonii.AAC.1
MSASLVGSEMCIRDSFTATEFAGAPSDARSCFSWEVFGSWFGAVGVPTFRSRLRPGRVGLRA